MQSMELGSARPDLDEVAALGAQARSQHPEDPDAGTTVAFLAGYAAGLAEGSGQADFDRSHRASLSALRRMLTQGQAAEGTGDTP